MAGGSNAGVPVNVSRRMGLQEMAQTCGAVQESLQFCANRFAEDEGVVEERRRGMVEYGNACSRVLRTRIMARNGGVME